MVELAVSITIIGLIAAAVTTSINVKHRLELNEIVDNIGTIKTATTQFQTNYGGIPGDLYNATTQIGSTTTNGDGDSTIEDNTTAASSESLLFWQHLGLAGLIDGEYDMTNTLTGKMGGDMKNSIYSADTYDFDTTTHGPIRINVSKYISGSANNYNSDAGELKRGNGIFTTKEAYAFDVKYDDGKPKTGIIRADDGANAAAEDCVDVDADPALTAYKLTNVSNVPCVMYFWQSAT